MEKCTIRMILAKTHVFHFATSAFKENAPIVKNVEKMGLTVKLVLHNAMKNSFFKAK